jgi:hypothetical protein
MLNDALLSDTKSGSSTPAMHFMTPANEFYTNDDPDLGLLDNDEEQANAGGLYSSSWPAGKAGKAGKEQSKQAPLSVTPSTPSAPWTRKKKIAVSLATVIGVLSVTLAVVFAVVVPSIVQTSVDGSTITFNENSVHSVAPDGSTFMLTASMDITCSGALPATLNPTKLTFSYSALGSALGSALTVGTATLPSVSFTPSVSLVHQDVDELFTLHDEAHEGWNAFAYDLTRQDAVTWHVSAKPTVTVQFPLGFSLDYGASLEKDITMLGLGGLNQFEITNFDVVTPADSEHAFFSINARLYNPSLSSVTPLGALSLEALTDTGSKLGYVQATNVTMRPGWNEIYLTGPVIPESIDEMNAAMSDYFIGKPVNVLSRMNDISYDGQDFPASDNPLFEAAMLGLEINAVLKQDHADLTMHALTNTLAGTTDLALFNPLSAQLHVTRLDMNVNYDSYPFGTIHDDLDTTIAGGDTVVAPGVKLVMGKSSGELAIIAELTADLQTLVPVPGKDIKPEDCNTLAHLEGKCEYKGYFCLGCTGNMTVQVADLELTLSYWQAEDFPVCESEGTYDTAACQWMELGTVNPCNPPLRGRKYDSDETVV